MLPSSLLQVVLMVLEGPWEMSEQVAGMVIQLEQVVLVEWGQVARPTAAMVLGPRELEQFQGSEAEVEQVPTALGQFRQSMAAGVLVPMVQAKFPSPKAAEVMVVMTSQGSGEEHRLMVQGARVLLVELMTGVVIVVVVLVQFRHLMAGVVVLLLVQAEVSAAHRMVQVVEVAAPKESVLVALALVAKMAIEAVAALPRQ